MAYLLPMTLLFLLHRICSCLQYKAVVRNVLPRTDWCCLVVESEIQYRKPGDLVLYYEENAVLKCAIGWTGRNCDTCAPGWTGPACDACEGFGFSTESNCTECIQNGYWTGSYLIIISNDSLSEIQWTSMYEFGPRYVTFDSYFCW